VNTHVVIDENYRLTRSLRVDTALAALDIKQPRECRERGYRRDAKRNFPKESWKAAVAKQCDFPKFQVNVVGSLPGSTLDEHPETNNLGGTRPVKVDLVDKEPTLRIDVLGSGRIAEFRVGLESRVRGSGEPERPPPVQRAPCGRIGIHPAIERIYWRVQLANAGADINYFLLQVPQALILVGELVRFLIEEILALENLELIRHAEEIGLEVTQGGGGDGTRISFLIRLLRLPETNAFLADALGKVERARVSSDGDATRVGGNREETVRALQPKNGGQKE